MMSDELDLIAIFKNQLESELRRATEYILELEKNPGKSDTLNGIMREFHTIKGAARAIQFNEIKETAHSIENIYHALIAGQITQRKSLINLTLYTIDLINEMLNARIEKKTLPQYDQLFEWVDSYLSGKEPQISKISQIYKKDEKIETSDKQTQKPLSPKPTSDEPQYKFFEEKDQIADKLLNLSGEISVAVTSLDVQRQTMKKVSNNLELLWREFNRFFKNDDDFRDKEYSIILFDKTKELKNQQSVSMEMLNIIENRLHFLSTELEHEVTQSRLVPIDTLFSSFPRIVRDLSQELGKECELVTYGEQTRIDRGVLEAIRVPLLHLIRNALDHGIESPNKRLQLGKIPTGKLEIKAQPLSSSIFITISDDGTGVDIEEIKETVISRGDTTIDLWNIMNLNERQQFLFLPGISTAKTVTETSGRGVGLDIVKTNIEKIGGRIRFESAENKGTSFILEMPQTLSLTRCLLVNAGNHYFFGNQYYAFPQNDIEKVCRIKSSDLRVINGQNAVRINEDTLMLYDFASSMELAPIKYTIEEKHVLILNFEDNKIALVVEEIFDEHYIVSRKIDSYLGKIRDVDGVTLLRDGKMALIVDIKDLFLTLSDHNFNKINIEKQNLKNVEPENKKHKILVVEDSQTVREVERHFLESAGYDVVTAINGADGLNKLKVSKFDMVISDIDMPRMNGIEMIKEIRKDPKYGDIPIIVVSYKDREEDRLAAKDAGANLYITKAAFDSKEMLLHISRFIDNKAHE
ncbi:MAG: response regulator [Desulfobacterales bacterium]|nr:response regulator [Desulfobacterales bacterium]